MTRIRAIFIGAALFAATTVPAAAAGWTSTSGEEDWGPTCYLSYDIEGGSIGFMAGVGSQANGYVDAGSGVTYPAKVDSLWEVDDMPGRKLAGTVSDYFGYPIYPIEGQALIGELETGKSLKVTIPGLGDETVTLDGAAAAVPAFNNCVRG